MLVLPGALILLMGVIVLPWTLLEKGWSSGTQQSGIIFVVFGGILFFGGLIYGFYYYFKYTPKPVNATADVSPYAMPVDHSVELVGVFRITGQDTTNSSQASANTFDNAAFDAITIS